MNKNSTKRRTQMIAIGLASVALLAVVAFGAIQALTPADAEKIALDQNPGTTVLSTELDDENGASVYSVELSGDIEVKVDPNSGAILAADPDDDQDDEHEDSAATDDQDDDQIENEQDGDFDTED